MDAPATPHPTDPTLRSYGLGKLEGPPAEAVRGHLEACPDCRARVAELSADSFLGRLRGAAGPDSGASRTGGVTGVTSSNAWTPPPSETLPPGLADHPDYQIRRELGRGGMGVVYLAHNALMGRDEVLKVIGSHILERPEVAERFLREIRAVARLRHPNIVAAYSAMRLRESLVFSMEYVEGFDLARVVRSGGPMPVAHACGFAHQAALGIQHAHEEGLVHRDIKPSNLMLSKRGGKPVIKVLDFGLAKASREQKANMGLTSQGQALGTPDYIAPEQILDAPGADIRADIYSLGGTLYFLLAGRPPFQADSLYDMYQAHISRDAAPLNFLRPEVPAELAALVAKMMAKDPARRFQAPEDVARALAPFFRKAGASGTIPAVATKPERPAPRPEAAPPAAREGTPAAPPASPKAGPPAAEDSWTSQFARLSTEAPEIIPKPARAPAAAPPRRPGLSRPVIAASALLALLALCGGAWLAGVFRVHTPYGVVELRGLAPDADVTVDGTRGITVHWPEGGGPAEIRVEEGTRRIVVAKDGFEAKGDVVVVKDGVKAAFDARLVPLPGGAEPRGAGVPEARASVGFDPLFNGHDLEGWTFPIGDAGDWSVRDGVIRGEGSGPNSTLATQGNYGDFRLRMEIRSDDRTNKHLLFRASGGREDDANYRFVTGGVLGTGEFEPLGGYRFRPAGPHLDDGYFTKEGLRPIVAPRLSPMTRDVWHAVEVTARGSTFRMSVDGREVSAFEDTESRLARGSIAFRVGWGGVIEIRNAEIQELDAPRAAAESGRGDRFVPLFNGKDLAGWQVSPGNLGEWKVVDGELVGTGGGVGRPALLMTTGEDYTDFRLRARIFHDGKAKQLVVRWDSDGTSYDGYGIRVGGRESANGDIVPFGSINKAEARPLTGPITWLTVAKSLPLILDEWYDIEITAVGDTIRTSIDSKPVAEFKDREPPHRSGRITLGAPGQGTVRYKEILIEKLGAAPAGASSGPGEAAARPSAVLSPVPLADRRARIVRGSWQIRNGELIQSSRDRDTMLVIGDPSWSDYDLKFRAMATGGTHGFKALFHYEDTRNFCQFATGNYHNKGEDLSYVSEGRWGRGPGMYQEGGIEFGRWYDVKVEVRRSRVRCFLNGAPLFSHDDGRFVRGRVGFSTWDAQARFRDIKVTAPDGATLFEGLPQLPVS